MASAPSDNSGLVDAVKASADRLGVAPSDLLTSISYETGGKLSPATWGGAGGKHLGLIQFSPENQQKYGVRPDQTPGEQMGAVEAYLRDRGVKPGHGLLDIYAAINAGRVGLYNRTDENNGGAPGTVADKVASMAGHRMRANAMLGMPSAPLPQRQAGAAPEVQQAGGAPLSLAPSGAGQADDALQSSIQALAAIPASVEQDDAMQPMPFQQIRYVQPRKAVRR